MTFLEVKYRWDTPHIPPGLKVFLKKYPETRRAFVVSGSNSRRLRVQNTEIDFIPLEQASAIPSMILS